MKVIGIGLNKTGTKTLEACLEYWGYKHFTYDLESFHQYQRGDYDALWRTMDRYDSFEDWPWPLMYKEIDAKYPDAKFVLTTRKSPEAWFASLCKMAVRMGPLDDFEKHIYGYSMPQGHEAEHIKIYNAHNQAVEEHFADRPGKLLKICWEHGHGWQELADFLGETAPDQPLPHVNQSAPLIYKGNNQVMAWFNRISYTTYRQVGGRVLPANVRKRIKDLFLSKN